MELRRYSVLYVIRDEMKLYEFLILNEVQLHISAKY